MRLAFTCLLCAAACGGGDDAPAADAPPVADAAIPADADTRDLLVRLNDLPGVTATEFDCQYDPDARCFDLDIVQPIDHQNPGGGTFVEDVTLLHRDFAAPMVALTTGYWNFYGDYPGELAQVLDANQIVIEHRFFAGSRPPTGTDWSTLTIAQAAADEHQIIDLLKRIYDTSKWVTTGESKGGMTASYHRRFYPDDVDATVPYVAPISFAAGDPRYATFLDTIGPASCRQALRNVIVELLRPVRFDAMLQRAQTQAQSQGLSYSRVLIGPAVESAILGIEWSFWQYVGVGSCGQVPGTGASNDTMWSFLEYVSPVSGSSDTWVASFDAYYFQAAYELGDPDAGLDFTQGLTRYTDADYDGFYPPGVTIPPYRPEAMADIDQWVQSSGSRLLFIYGEWDPWAGGKYELGAATDSLRVIAPRLDHSAGLSDLTAADRTAAFARLEAWTGVTPNPNALKPVRGAPRPAVPRIPPALMRAWQLRR